MPTLEQPLIKFQILKINISSREKFQIEGPYYCLHIYDYIEHIHYIIIECSNCRSQNQVHEQKEMGLVSASGSSTESRSKKNNVHILM